MKKLTALALALLVLPAFPAVLAEERVAEPLEPFVFSELGLAFPKLIYEYVGKDYGLCFTPTVWAEWRPEKIEIEISHANGWGAQAHNILGTIATEGDFIHPGTFDGRGESFCLKAFGAMNVKMFIDDALAEFALNLSTFDFNTRVCDLNRREVQMSFNIRSMENLPTTIDRIAVELENGYVFDVVEDVPWSFINGGNGSAELPFRKWWYRRLLENKKLQVSITIAGETVTWPVGFPDQSAIISWCGKG